MEVVDISTATSVRWFGRCRGGRTARSPSRSALESCAPGRAIFPDKCRATAARRTVRGSVWTSRARREPSVRRKPYDGRPRRARPANRSEMVPAARPCKTARIFRASTRASRRANCAVGGHGLPVLPSLSAAQSPTAHTPGCPGTAIVLSTTTAPRRSVSRGNVRSNGFGAVPAVQTSVRARTLTVAQDHCCRARNRSGGS